MGYSWNNPTPEEAEEAYWYNRNRYYNAASEYNAARNRAQSLEYQKSASKSQMQSLSTQRVNLEKRLDGVEKIIRCMVGSGGWLATNVPSAISKASKALEKADESFRKSIRLDGGISAARMAERLRVKSVEEDANSSSALSLYRKEKVRIENEINEIRKNLNALSDKVNQLNGQLNSCYSTQNSARKVMNSTTYEMNHYRKYF